MADDDGNIIKDIATDLKIMTAKQTSAAPTATTAETILGNIDPNDKNLTPVYGDDGTTIVSGGVPMTFSFYDKLGELYTVKMMVTKDEVADDAAENSLVPYTVRVADVYNSEGKSIFLKEEPQTDGSIKYVNSGAKITFGTGASFGVDDSVNGDGIENGVNTETKEFRLKSTQVPFCLLYTSPSPRDGLLSRMPSSA